MFEKKGKRGRLVCGGPAADGCGEKSDWVEIRSPAAPELSVCEKLEDSGWTYDIGFFAMLQGHTTICPRCSNGKVTQSDASSVSLTAQQ
jgi:hypothetical protein